MTGGRNQIDCYEPQTARLIYDGATMEKCNEGVKIGDAPDFVKLVYRGGPRKEDGMTSVDIEISAGPFQGTVADETLVGVSDFVSELSKLYDTLKGEATLSSYEKLKLSVKGDGKGGLWINVEIYGRHHPLSKICFEFGLDQTYLPKIISNLKTQFLLE